MSLKARFGAKRMFLYLAAGPYFFFFFTPSFNIACVPEAIALKIQVGLLGLFLQSSKIGRGVLVLTSYIQNSEISEVNSLTIFVN